MLNMFRSLVSTQVIPHRLAQPISKRKLFDFPSTVVYVCTCLISLNDSLLFNEFSIIKPLCLLSWDFIKQNNCPMVYKSEINTPFNSVYKYQLLFTSDFVMVRCWLFLKYTACYFRQFPRQCIAVADTGNNIYCVK